MPARVLVPFDQSEQARRAFDEAVELFPDAEFVLLNVFSRGPVDSSDDIDDSQQADIETRRTEMLEEAARERGLEGPVETALKYGRPERQIVEFAEEHDVDHVVMGSHGRTGASRILLGSVAENVVRRAPVTVTVVR